MANDSGVQPGWYADPLGRFELRYFNGAAWTADVSADGARFVDPMGIEVGGATRKVPTAPVPIGDTGTNSAATAAMVLGIVAISIAWLPFIVFFGALAAVLAVVFGIIGTKRARLTGAGRSRAIVGLVTGTSGLVAAVLGVALTVIVLDVYDEYLEPEPHEVAITSCELVGSRATATGVLENSSTSTASFTVMVGFVRPGTDNADRTSRVDLDDVGPGERVEFEVERQVDLEDIDCIVLDVNGPLPFGLAVD